MCFSLVQILVEQWRKLWSTHLKLTNLAYFKQELSNTVSLDTSFCSANKWKKWKKNQSCHQTPFKKCMFLKMSNSSFQTMLALAKLAHFYRRFIFSLVVNRQVETDPSWVRVIVQLHCHFFFFLHFCPFMLSICLPVSICKFAVWGLHPYLVSELSRMCIFAWNWREASMRNMIFHRSASALTSM